MVEFTTVIKKFEEQGEKTGWTYIDVAASFAEQLMPENKRSFRVKGFLDNYNIQGVSLLPMGEGNFIIPINAIIRKKVGKGKGAMLAVKLEADKSPELLSPALLECLSDEPVALAYFKKLPGSHQKYYSKWVESAKTAGTKAKRIAQAVTACAHGLGFNEMIKSAKNERNGLLEI